MSLSALPPSLETLAQQSITPAAPSAGADPGDASRFEQALSSPRDDSATSVPPTGSADGPSPAAAQGPDAGHKSASEVLNSQKTLTISLAKIQSQARVLRAMNSDWKTLMQK